MVQDSELPGGVCSKCCHDMTPGATVRLWDGKDYCENCVEEACPGLAQYARSHETLEEEMPHSAWRIVINHAIIGTVGMSCLGILLWAIVVGLGADRIDPGSLFLLLLFPMAGLPISILFGIGHAVLFALDRPVMSVASGQLEIAIGHDRETIPLSACQWYVGKTSHMNYSPVMYSKTRLLWDTAVVIIIPRCPELWRSSRRVAAGFTEDTRLRWESFLTLAAVPQRAFGLPRGSSV